MKFKLKIKKKITISFNFVYNLFINVNIFHLTSDLFTHCYFFYVRVAIFFTPQALCKTPSMNWLIILFPTDYLNVIVLNLSCCIFLFLQKSKFSSLDDHGFYHDLKTALIKCFEIWVLQAIFNKKLLNEDFSNLIII